MKSLMILIIFLLLGGFFIISNHELYLNNNEDVDEFLLSYADWIEGLIGNSKTVTGYLVKMDWMPEHEFDGSS